VIAIESHDPLAPLRAASKQARKLTVSDDPLGWASLTLPHITFWSKQVEIMEAVDQHSRVAVRACHDSSKSFTASVIASRWLDTHPLGQARVITTAPTATQVRGILWVEINQLHEAADLPGRVNQTEWWIGSYLAGIGRKPADYNPAAFQGLHARYPLIIIDEASGVPTAIIEAAETLATNVNAKILMIGNPDDPSSMFADIHNNPAKHGYHTIKISAWDTPNFTGEPVSQLLHEVLLSKEWVENRRKAWGEDHPFWLSKVEAEFPSIDTKSVIKLHDLVAARVPYAERQSGESQSPPLLPLDVTPGTTGNTQPHARVTTTHPDVGLLPGLRVLGVDVAGSDDGDETVCRLILPQNRPTTEHRFRSSDPEQVAEFIFNTILATYPDKVVVDSVGVGFGIIGLVRHRITERTKSSAASWATSTRRPPIVEGFNGAEQANQFKLYVNKRAELWWEARLLFQRGQVDTSQADDLENLEAQLVVPRYTINKGRIQVEAKADLKSRLGRSPDNADAFLYGIWEAINSSTMVIAKPPQTFMPNMRSASTFSQRHSQTARSARIPVRRTA
jgi:hypothetical protein